jgi:hypothetical protein
MTVWIKNTNRVIGIRTKEGTWAFHSTCEIIEVAVALRFAGVAKLKRIPF